MDMALLCKSASPPHILHVLNLSTKLQYLSLNNPLPPTLLLQYLHNFFKRPQICSKFFKCFKQNLILQGCCKALIYLVWNSPVLKHFCKPSMENRQMWSQDTAVKEINLYVILEQGEKDVKRAEQVRVLCASSNWEKPGKAAVRRPAPGWRMIGWRWETTWMSLQLQSNFLWLKVCNNNCSI